MTRVQTLSTIVALISASAAVSGCSSDDSGGKAGTGGSGGASGGSAGAAGSATGGTAGSATGGAAGSATGGAAGAAGAAGNPGDGGSCKSCAQMVITSESDLTKACAGNSSDLILAFVQCTCQPTVCGGSGQGCEQACQGGQVDAACVACDQTAAAGPCKTEFDACMADQ
jgi:hypothetical protein